MPHKVDKCHSASSQKLPSRTEILQPPENALGNRKVKRTVHAEVVIQTPVLHFPDDLNCKTKAPTKDDIGHFLLSVYREVFRPKKTATDDDDDEGDHAIHNGFRLAELNQKQVP